MKIKEYVSIPFRIMRDSKLATTLVAAFLVMVLSPLAQYLGYEVTQELIIAGLTTVGAFLLGEKNGKAKEANKLKAE